MQDRRLVISREIQDYSSKLDYFNDREGKDGKISKIIEKKIRKLEAQYDLMKGE